MPTYYLRPDGTVTAGWGVTGSSTNAALNGTAVQPTAGETGSFLQTNGNGTVAEVTVGTTTLAGGETVTGLTVWEYGKADGLAGGHTFQAYKGTTALGTGGSTPDSGALQWRSSVYSGALTQAEVDDLRIRLTNGAGGFGSNYAYEAYIELTTTTTTMIAGTRTIKYDIQNLVAATRTIKYDILNIVAQTRTVKWNLANFVSNTRTLWWDVAGNVSATRVVKWDIAVFLAATRTLKWDITTNVSKTLTLKYDVVAFVNNARTLVWNIGNVVVSGVLLPHRRRRGTYSPSAESSGPST